MGEALWWSGDPRGCVDYRARAFTAYRRDGNDSAAVVVALQLAVVFFSSLGNDIAAQGWLGRAESLGAADDEDLRPWYDLVRGYISPDIQVAVDLARRALEDGRRLQDRDLELCALCDLGLALVRSGIVADGLALIDEGRSAPSPASTPGSTPSYSPAATCSRPVTWSPMSIALPSGAASRMRSWRSRMPIPERRVPDAVRQRAGLDRCVVGCRNRADRRPRGGRPCNADAAGPRLGSARPPSPASGPPRRSRSARGRCRGATGCPGSRGGARRAEQASSGGRRARAAPRPDVGPTPHPRTVLDGRGCALATADSAAAHRIVAELRSLADDYPHQLMRAHAEMAAGRLASTESQRELAVAHLDAALRHFDGAGLIYEAARARRELARVLIATQPAAAAVEATRALNAFHQLGAGRDADNTAALLRRWVCPRLLVRGRRNR